MRQLRHTLTTLGLLTLAGGWLVGSESGLQILSNAVSGPQLQISEAHGRLFGPLQIGQLRWQDADGNQLNIDDLDLDWSPRQLLLGELRLDRLQAARVAYLPGPPTPPGNGPDDLSLPFAVDAPHIAISRLDYGKLHLADDCQARLTSDGQHHRLSDLKAHNGALQLSAELELGGRDGLPLTLNAQVKGELEQHPIQLTLGASGPLREITLLAHAEKGVRGQASATLTPFAANAFRDVHIALDELDPAAWRSQWPSARIAIDADLAPQGEAISGRLALQNRQPGPLDRQRLPLASLRGQLHWQDQQLRLSALDARQTSKSSQANLSGEARWQSDTLQLKLTARQFDAAEIHSLLRSTRLNGPISAEIGDARQNFATDLADPAFRLRAHGEHAGGRWQLPLLELAAGNALLSAQGELADAAAAPFKFSGRLQNFDPARFLKATAAWPKAQLNADWSVTGAARPELTAQAQFNLSNSQWAGQPLRGQGRLNLQGQHLLASELQLTAGNNSLIGGGAFGRTGDRFSVRLDAPQLTAFGLEGGLQGEARIDGSPERWQLNGQLNGPRFGLPGQFRLDQPALDFALGNTNDAPLSLNLSVGKVSTPDLPLLARQLKLQLAGQWPAHQLSATSDLLDGNHLSLSLSGGLNADNNLPRRWQGRLLDARLSSKDSARNAHLDTPAPLTFSGEGWQVGPLQLSGDRLDWRAQVTAQADARHVQASGEVKGSRIGQVRGELDAALRGPYALEGDRSWRGGLNARIADLGWLGEFIGEGWQSAGNLEGRIELSGTPNLPRLNGQLQGRDLALRAPETGLHLANGVLAARLNDNRLRIEQLNFDSLLQAPPRALKLASERNPDDKTPSLGELTARPGRLEIAGELQVDRNQADNAALEIRLDRVGAYQLAEQWLTVSGKASVDWRNGLLGLHGGVTADAGYWQLAPGGAPRLSDDVIVRRPGNGQATPLLRPRQDIDLTVDLGPRFFFAGLGLSSRLAGDVRLSARERDLPRASGSIRTVGGHFEAYGQKLDIERGILNFRGLPENPALDVRAVRKGLSVEPGVQIGGTVQKPVVRLISDPDLPDPEKLAWLVLGHGPEQTGAGDAQVLLAAAGGLLGNDAGNLVGQIRKTFGFDELGIRQGQIGESGGRLPTSRVAGSSVDSSASTGNQIFSVGKRLSSNALLSYEQVLGKAESVVKLTVTLSRNLSLVGRAGSDNALDFFYTVMFGQTDPQKIPKK